MSVFDLLHERVREVAKERFGSPSRVQEVAIPRVLEGKNCLIVAPTGLGKTEAALLPVFSRILERKSRPIAALYVTPLRALNRDLLDRISFWSVKLGLGVTVRHGDTTSHQRRIQVEHPDEIFIVTPEQLQAMLPGKKMRKLLKNLEFVVIDEVHELVGNRRGAQLACALARLRELCDPQIVCLSATVGSPRETASYFGCGEVLTVRSEKEMEISVIYPVPEPRDFEAAEKLSVTPEIAARLRVLAGILKSSGSVLVFTNTRETAEVLSSRLRLYDSEISHDIHHSSLSRDSRTEAERKFKRSEIDALIATSSLELGIDIGSVDTVVQYGSPRQVVKLLQRTGRSGHAPGRKSKAVVIATDCDDLFETCAIVELCRSGEIERTEVCLKPMDVLAHQIAGILIEYYSADARKIAEILRRAAPFSGLSEEDFWKVVDFMESIRVIRRNGSELIRTRKTFDYYFSNLSTIPDSRSYSVVSVSGERVGSIDEAFFASLESENFIVKGRPWRVVSVEGRKILVEPSADVESAVPAWEGELIPVPEAVARKVSELRKRISGGSGIPFVDRAGAERMKKILEDQERVSVIPEGFCIEEREDRVVLHTCAGTRINDAIGAYLSSLLADFGSSVMVRSDPYRVSVKGVRLEDVVRILETTGPGDVKKVIEGSVARLPGFSRIFLSVAKRFGAISREAEVSGVGRLVKAFEDTPVFEEAVREIMRKYDCSGAEKVLTSGFRIIPPGPLGAVSGYGDVVVPEKPEEILKAVKKRLETTRLRVVCLNCGKFSVTLTPASDPVCLVCGSRLLGVTSPEDRKSLKVVKKHLSGQALDPEEELKLRRLKRTADVVIAYRKDGLLCLAGRGVGPETAMRILSSPGDIYRKIYEAELKYAETKRFWTKKL